MKSLFVSLLASILAVPTFAQADTTNDAASSTTSAAPPASDQAAATLTLPASAAELTAPMVLNKDTISQPDQTELADGGKAVFTFTITNASNYLIQAVVNVTGEDANSFFVNVDAQPESPLMIWDIEETGGFEERTVSWRGTGDADPTTSQFKPKVFNLSAGEHKLIIVGREPTQLKSISLRPATK